MNLYASFLMLFLKKFFLNDKNNCILLKKILLLNSILLIVIKGFVISSFDTRLQNAPLKSFVFISEFILLIEY